jgi:uncharacterized protein YdhG (YjbR/CyaY superfamily)
MKIDFKDIDTYLEIQPADVSTALNRIRKIVHDTVPEAQECISYGMPSFKYHGSLVYFAAFKDHCSFFPGGGDIMEMFKEDLKDFKTSKGTIQFTLDKPIPASLLKKIIRVRKLQNEEKAHRKKKL